MKIMALILLFILSFDCRAFANSESIERIILGNAVNIPHEEQRDLAQRFSSWSSNYSNINKFLENEIKFNSQLLNSSVNPTKYDYYEQLGVDPDKFAHFGIPEIKNGQLIDNVIAAFKAFKDRVILSMYLAQQGFSQLSAIEMRNAQEELVSLSKRIMAISAPNRVKGNVLLKILKDTLLDAEQGLRIHDPITQYRLDEALALLTPEFLKDRSKWYMIGDLLKNLGTLTVINAITVVGFNIALFVVPTVGAMISGLATEIITPNYGDYVYNWTDLMMQWTVNGFRYVCMAGAAAGCYITRGVILNEQPQITNLRHLSRFTHNPTCSMMLEGRR